ncbi:protein of unknown function [Lachnospiraceae bacterium C7]|nr:protein of unknown function [Lachnospiraceae bacterium C7]
MEKVKIYVMTHKEFTPPSDPIYVPFHVKTKIGDNIAEKNCYYSELTGLYWVWKNEKDADIVGTCHYRRYLLNDNKNIFNKEEICHILKKYDVITTKTLDLNFSYYYGFGENHKYYYLDEIEKIIKDIKPEYYDIYVKLVNEKHTYFGNMLICRKDLYDKYMEWLFDIFTEAEKRIVVDEEDSYHRRIYGFISEFLQYVWIKYNKLDVYETMVGMLGEKAETREVRHNLFAMLEEGKVDDAKQYILDARKKRPDILMEASDVTGELHICMEIIAIAGLERQKYGKSILDYRKTHDELIEFCNRLNTFTIRNINNVDIEKEKAWLIDNHATDVAFEVAQKCFANANNVWKK